VADILVLDRDQKNLETCGRDLTSLGYHPIITSDVENAHRLLNSEHPALLLTDILSLAGYGSKIFHSAHDVHPQVPVVILTGIATIDTAVQALKEAAQFYFLKPINLDHLKAALERVIPRSRQDSDQYETEPQPRNTSGEIIVGASHVIREVLDIAGRVAHSDANIVLFGESVPPRNCSHRRFTPAATGREDLLSRWTVHHYRKTCSKLNYLALKRAPLLVRSTPSQG
jgi:DNA-binding NtrC family response regulator